MKKRVRCADVLGNPACPAVFTGHDSEEVLALAWHHVMEYPDLHPDLIAHLEDMNDRRIAAWQTEFYQRWHDAPDLDRK